MKILGGAIFFVSLGILKMRAAGAKNFGFMRENMPEKPKIDQNPTKKC